MVEGSSVAQAARRTAGERDELRGLLAQVEAAFGRSEPRAGSGLDVVAARLDTLRGPLLAHFDDEERAGIFDGVEERAPELARTCVRLRNERRSLIRHLDVLRAASPIERRGPVWLRGVRRFITILLGHEARENVLLRRAYQDPSPSAKEIPRPEGWLP